MSITFTVTFDDCPHEDVLRVIEGEHPSNSLVLYVRCMFAACRQRYPSSIFDDERILGEVRECCHLDARLYGLNEETKRLVARLIIAAADPAHLRGEKSSI